MGQEGVHCDKLRITAERIISSFRYRLEIRSPVIYIAFSGTYPLD